MPMNQEKEARPKCIIYTRVSSGGQVDGTSLDSQDEACRKYAEREGWEVVKVFREEGVSAKMMQRPEFMAALDFLKEQKRKVRYFVMYKIDRISRNVEDQAIIMKTLRDAGVELKSASENIDDTPAGALLRNILWSFADFDNKVRAERCRAGLVARLRQGYWVSVAPPGYLNFRDPITKRSNLIPDPERASHIKWMFERRAGGESFGEIAKGMNNRGFRSKEGKKVKESFVERLIKKTEYMGLMRAFGEEVEGKYKPLISKELWYRAQAAGEERQRGHIARSSLNEKFPLRQLVYCSACNQNLTGSAPKGRDKHYEYYHHHNKECAARRSIPREDLKKLFDEKLEQFKPKAELFGVVKMIVLDVWKEKVQQHIDDQTTVQHRITELLNEKKTLLELKRKNPSLYTDAEFIEQKRDIDREVMELEAERSVEVELNRDFEDVVEKAFVYLSQPLESWERLDIKSKTEFQHALFPEGLPFDGEKFGTAKISLLIDLLGAANIAKSHLVQKVRINWNQLITEIQRFAGVYDRSLIRAIS